MINSYLNSNTHSANLLVDPVEILSTITSGTTAVVLLLLVFCMLLFLEIHFPKEKWPIKKLGQSCFTNISLFMFNNAVLSLLSISALLVLTEQYSNHGLLSKVTNPGWKIILSFILLDLVAYLWHVACHQFNFLWMFHKVHHSDPYLNVSTAFRLHIIELGIFVVMKAGFIIILGIDKTTALACETITTAFIMFHHTNIAFSGETQLSRLIIVPALHRVHHSIERIEHDQNYGAVMSLWDRLFGTLTEGEPEAIGIKNTSSLGFIAQLKLGFTSNHSIPNLPLFSAENDTYSMIATAAYYKALHRDFSPGSEIDDWLQAEAEICVRPGVSVLEIDQGAGRILSSSLTPRY